MDCKILYYLDGRPLTWLSDKTGIHRNTLSSYANNGVDPKLSNSYLITEAFNENREEKLTVYDIWPPAEK